MLIKHGAYGDSYFLFHMGSCMPLYYTKWTAHDDAGWLMELSLHWPRYIRQQLMLKLIHKHYLCLVLAHVVRFRGVTLIPVKGLWATLRRSHLYLERDTLSFCSREDDCGSEVCGLVVRYVNHASRVVRRWRHPLIVDLSRLCVNVPHSPLRIIQSRILHSTMAVQERSSSYSRSVSLVFDHSFNAYCMRYFHWGSSLSDVTSIDLSVWRVHN